MDGVRDLIVPLVVAFGLSSVVGIEREMRHKVAGLRTHALVGLGAAMFTLIGKYGFTDVVAQGVVTVNPSQMAGQVITGIGFLGGGIIFVRRESARGIITAASIWVVAAVGMAAGAELYGLALAGTLGQLVVSLAFTPVTRRLRRDDAVVGEVRLDYRQDTAALREAMAELTHLGCTVEALTISPATGSEDVRVVLEIHGPTTLTDLTSRLAHIDGVVAVSGGPAPTDHDGG